MFILIKLKVGSGSSEENGHERRNQCELKKMINGEATDNVLKEE